MRRGAPPSECCLVGSVRSCRGSCGVGHGCDWCRVRWRGQCLCRLTPSPSSRRARGARRARPSRGRADGRRARSRPGGWSRPRDRLRAQQDRPGRRAAAPRRRRGSRAARWWARRRARRAGGPASSAGSARRATRTARRAAARPGRAPGHAPATCAAPCRRRPRAGDARRTPVRPTRSSSRATRSSPSVARRARRQSRGRRCRRSCATAAAAAPGRRPRSGRRCPRRGSRRCARHPVVGASRPAAMPQQGRLAAAARAQDADDLARRDRERDVTDDQMRPTVGVQEGTADAAELDLELTADGGQRAPFRGTHRGRAGGRASGWGDDPRGDPVTRGPPGIRHGRRSRKASGGYPWSL